MCIRDRIMRVIRYMDTPIDFFCKVLVGVEEKINSRLIKSGGFFKIIFQAPNQRWHTFHLKGNGATGHELECEMLRDGPWNYFDELFGKRNRLFSMKDVLFHKDDLSEIQAVKNLYKTLQHLSQTTTSSFESIDKDRAIWNMYMYPLKSEIPQNEIHELVRQYFTKVCKLKRRRGVNLEEFFIPRAMIVYVHFANTLIMNRSNMMKLQQLKSAEIRQRQNDRIKLAENEVAKQKAEERRQARSVANFGNAAPPNENKKAREDRPRHLTVDGRRRREAVVQVHEVNVDKIEEAFIEKEEDNPVYRLSAADVNEIIWDIGQAIESSGSSWFLKLTAYYYMIKTGLTPNQLVFKVFLGLSPKQPPADGVVTS
eukprot:TRINITY_DN3395_c0_g1_i4.p1 TRINITY_DN3395_c0_g1~~TRINITY_DN3395_c0_g1_i4.p1  ORF type:complete len:397 (+),score=91.83 TRINITY_DN3395_c0_g1_i4:87-1193(+)